MDYRCKMCGEKCYEPKLISEYIDGYKCFTEVCPRCGYEVEFIGVIEVIEDGI